ncbi:MAG: cyclic nucleotide-binding domain-containing protein [Ferrovibrio sp.]
MGDYFKIAIVGSGPAGLAAAARAARRGVAHVLLERADHIADTLFRFQKGKTVMATPDILPLRSDISFGMGRREEVLGKWNQHLSDGINLRLETDIAGVSGRQGAFRLTTSQGEVIEAETVVLATGLQGNINRLSVPGADQALVQYQLDDPGEHYGETIVVIGAGDAAIENAIALAQQNTVIIVNRSAEFARAKPGNLDLITAAISKGQIECYYNAVPAAIGPDSITLQTARGDAEIRCDRIIARLGASPPRRFLQSCGVVFPSDSASALPEVSSTYESNVPGLYIVGALGGYPLIKQALNQGYEVVEHILGHPVEAADEPVLREKFAALGNIDVGAMIDRIRSRVPIFSGLNTLLLRELLLDSTIHVLDPGSVVFRSNDYSNSFYTIVDGAVDIQVDPARAITLGSGEYFGEMGLISGRRRTATVVVREKCLLIETQRRTMLKLRASVDEVRDAMDRIAVMRQISSYLAPGLRADKLQHLAATAVIRHFSAGETLFRQGEEGDSLHIIRSGSVTVSAAIGGREVVLTYLPAGNYVGEMALLANTRRTATVRAAVKTETICIDGPAFKAMIADEPALRADMERRFSERIVHNERMASSPQAGSIIEFLVAQGLGEATDVLLIDEALCVRCDNCEKACAETHGGVSRLDREAGPRMASLHIPTSCRHCEHPHCMTECPPDAIRRNPNGEVYIADSCIGCGNCERNCPYGVIHMAGPSEAPSNLLGWLFFGLGKDPGSRPAPAAEATPRKMAVKCDMCKDLAAGPACVRACPTGAALRASPEQFMSLAALTQFR